MVVADFGGGAHHQVFGALGHGESNDLADVFRSCQQHHHPVDARGGPSVRRSAVTKGLHQGGKMGFHVLGGVTGNLKGPHHNVAAVVADGAAAQFDAVAHDVVLIGFDG